MRILWKTLSGIILLALIGGAIFAFLFWARVPDMVASTLSKQLRTTVEIGDLKFSFSALTVDHLDIHNPKNFEMPKALTAEKIVIEVPPTHFFHDTIEIDQITVSNIYIGLEFDSPKSTKGNWSTLLHSAQSSQKKDTDLNKSVFIKRLLLKDIQAELYYESDRKVRRLKNIPQIELRNISSKGGNFTEQLMNSALGEAVKQIFVQENLKENLDKLLQSPLKDVIDPLKGLFGAEMLDQSP
jgi:uncharacterized protein involved in outer membrane biogenesis